MKPLPIARLLLLSLILLQAVYAEGQQSEEMKNPFSMAIRGHYGSILPHSKAISEISEANPWGIEADLAWHLMSESIWKQCFCYPRTGLSMNYLNFNLPEVLGYSVFLYPYLEPYIRPQKKINFSFRFGIGPAWVSKLYDAQTNPDNYFFSSHWSFIAVLNAAVNYRVTGRLNTRVAFNYNHISNGGLEQPNVGMDFLTLSAGFDYSFTEVRFPGRSKDSILSLYPRENWWDAYVLGTAKKAGTGEDQRYPVIGAGITLNHLTGQHLALNAGMEWISDFSLPDPHRAAILLGLDLLFGRFSFIHQWGIYFYEPYPAGSWAYQRYGINLRFSDRYYLGVNLKAHGPVAVQMDARLGILF